MLLQFDRDSEASYDNEIDFLMIRTGNILSNLLWQIYTLKGLSNIISLNEDKNDRQAETQVKHFITFKLRYIFFSKLRNVYFYKLKLTYSLILHFKKMIWKWFTC